ncbi:MAG: endonuclease domain-containing protein [Faecalibacterium sp.]
MKPNIVPKNGDMLPRARELRREMTPQERKLWYQFLRRYPVKIYKQRIIESFIADFYCSRAQLVIELDGAQHTTEQGLLYDRERSSIFSQYGLDVLRFSNYEVDLQFEAVCEKSIRRFNLAFEAALSRYMHKSSPSGSWHCAAMPERVRSFLNKFFSTGPSSG